jgi:hypothetical protein
VHRHRGARGGGRAPARGAWRAAAGLGREKGGGGEREWSRRGSGGGWGKKNYIVYDMWVRDLVVEIEGEI